MAFWILSKMQGHGTKIFHMVLSTNSHKIVLQAVEDFSDGCGLKFRLVIVSNSFDGKGMLASHR